MRTPPTFRGGLPEQPDRPEPTATLHYGRANGDRRSLVLTARDSRELDAKIIARIDDLRAAGNKMHRTDLVIDGETWTYEYNSTGEVETVFRNGEVTP